MAGSLIEVDLQITDTTSSSLEDIAYHILMIEYQAVVAEQFAYRMGQELRRVSRDNDFVNFKRLWLWCSFHNVEKDHNYFIQKLMRMKFKEGAQCTTASSPSVVTK